MAVRSFQTEAAADPSPSLPLCPAEQQLDLTSVDLRKLRVRELKKVLEDWGEACRGCAEKDDFVRRITELLPLHAGPPAPPPHSDL